MEKLVCTFINAQKKRSGKFFPYIEIWLTDVFEIESGVNPTCYIFLSLVLLI